ncbi:MAG: hypothetical protein DRP14_02735 [Candidatus Aenigmatarchaeota archaeon]|nr:MAG: hypothetical protein DRP14_02735 [Candidatus Aenigmarchaeota archaeon]
MAFRTQRRMKELLVIRYSFNKEVKCLFVQLQARPGATSLANIAISILFISSDNTVKDCMPGLGRGFQFQVSFI